MRHGKFLNKRLRTWMRIDLLDHLGIIQVKVSDDINSIYN